MASLMGMGGAAGAGDAMAQLFDQRMQAAKLAQQDALVRLKAQEQADALQQNLEQKRQAEADRTQAAQENAKIRQEGQTRLSFQMKPIGAPMSPTEGGQAEALGMPVTHVPGNPVQQTTGFMPLPTGGTGMQPMGALSPVSPPGGGAPPPPPGPAPMGPLMPMNKMMQTTADPSSPLSVPPSLARGATQADIEKQKADALAAAKPDAAVEAARVAAENRQENIRLAASLRPPPADKLVKVEHRDPASGKTVIEWLPQSEARGQKFEKGASGALETRLASAEAVSQTGNDIIAAVSSPKVAATLGPAMGRYNSMRDFIGDPPPEFSELAGQIESYALASMGVHGMRSAAGAEKIKGLLDKKHTPESLISTIKGLNSFSSHFMQNEGRTSTGASKPTAEELIKKYSVAP